ncbi:hypothetical protein [Burkholderia stabilis]|uniref:hypothetical protein n=1 Tax=Burkholderia stabilis TaxID=95485 RepID=UPI001F4B4C5C|nr:hypothetical protein [Burkholderia stabilis]
MENQSGIGQLTLGEIFFGDKLAPLWPLVISRPLKLFPTALGLMPGIPSVPSREFLVRIFTDYPTHQALLRDLVGDHFKNFENHVRGKHHVSPTTLKGIADKFGVDERFISAMKHGNAEGPLLPPLLSLFGLSEAIPNLFFAAVVKTGIPCQHCGGNLIDDRDSWWKKQPLRLPKPAYDLIERLLGALLVATGFYVLVREIEREAPIEEIIQLAHPSRHPFGNWIGKVMQSHGVESYYKLCSQYVADGTPLPIDENRISKWASGGELLPIAIGAKLTAGLTDAEVLQMDLHAARAIALIIDFATAATVGDAGPTRKLVQDMIFRRLETIHNHFRLFTRVFVARIEEKRQS